MDSKQRFLASIAHAALQNASPFGGNFNTANATSIMPTAHSTNSGNDNNFPEHNAPQIREETLGTSPKFDPAKQKGSSPSGELNSSKSRWNTDLRNTANGARDSQVCIAWDLECLRRQFMRDIEIDLNDVFQRRLKQFEDGLDAVLQNKLQSYGM